MNIEDVRAYCLSLPHADEDMRYGPDWLVMSIRHKIFVHINLAAIPPYFNVKLPPDVNVELRDRYEGVRPGYHMNKTHWSDITVEDFSDAQLREWIDTSYWIVRRSLPKRVQAELDAAE